MAIEQFEDIQGWQAGRKLVQMVYTETGKDSFALDWRSRDQIQGAAISILANIAEGFDCDTNSEMLRFLGFARRSASEVQSLLYIARDLSYISQDAFDQLYGRSESTRALIGGFVRYLKSNPDPRRVRG